MNKAVVLVVSNDAYCDLWDPFFRILERQWPDCPFAIFLGANYQTGSYERCKTICVGEDLSWGHGLKVMLEKINASHIIMFLEDFLLACPVQSDLVMNLLELAQRMGVGCLRLRPAPPPSRKIRFHDDLGECLRGDDYRVSTQVAIWDKTFLLKLVEPDMSAWDFEHVGTLRSYSMPEKIWSVYEPVIQYVNGLERGMWTEQGVATCGMHGIEVNLGDRGYISNSELATKRLNNMLHPRAMLKKLMPPPLRRLLRLMKARSYEPRSVL